MAAVTFLKFSDATGSASGTFASTGWNFFYSDNTSLDTTDMWVAVFLHEHPITTSNATDNGWTHLGTLGPKQYLYSSGPDVYRNVYLTVYYKTVDAYVANASGVNITQSSTGRITAFGGVFRCDVAERTPLIVEVLSAVSEDPTTAIPIPQITSDRDGEMHLYIGAGGYDIPYSQISGTTSFKRENPYSYTGVEGAYIARNNGGTNTGGGTFDVAGPHSNPNCQLAYSIRLSPEVRPEILSDTFNVWAEPEHQDSVSLAGGDDKWAYLEFLFHADGEQDSDHLADAGPKDYTQVISGAATGDGQIDTVVKKFGTGSLRLTGNSNTGSAPYTRRGGVPTLDLSPALGTADLTYEFFVRPVNRGQPTLSWYDYNYLFYVGNLAWNEDYITLAQDTQWGMSLEVYKRVAGVWTGYATDTYDEAFYLETGIWYHVALVKYGDRFDWYVDGVRKGNLGTFTLSGLDIADSKFVIGDIPTTFNGGQGYNGYFDEIRLTRLARYMDEFDPPTEAFLGIPPEILSAASALTSAFSFADTASFESRYYRTATGQATLSRTAATQMFFKPILAEGASLRDSPIAGWPLTVAETFNLPVAAVISFAHRVIESLQLTQLLDPDVSYRVALNDGLNALDLLSRFAAGAVVESLTTEALASPSTKLTPVATGSVSLTTLASPQFVIRVMTNESLNLEDTRSLQMLFNPSLLERVQVSLAYVSPGNSVTTWAVNARTGAVTEYMDYEFNSFAEVGRQYLGASSGGLYELSGDTDAGSSIIAKMKTGYGQFAGSRLTHMKAAYIGLRGSGDFILRVETSDGNTYNYAIRVASMKTHKINMGRGIRARYFAFELESTGQDFDLENIKFVPLIAMRRV